MSLERRRAAATNVRSRARVGVLAASCLAATALLASPPLPRRVLLVSFDGIGGLDLSARLARRELGPDGFAKAARLGTSAKRRVEVTPSLTAVSHAAISSGAPPGRTGIVSNWLHIAGAPLVQRTSGFSVEPDTETIWERARR